MKNEAAAALALGWAKLIQADANGQADMVKETGARIFGAHTFEDAIGEVVQGPGV